MRGHILMALLGVVKKMDATIYVKRSHPKVCCTDSSKIFCCHLRDIYHQHVHSFYSPFNFSLYIYYLCGLISILSKIKKITLKCKIYFKILDSAPKFFFYLKLLYIILSHIFSIKMRLKRYLKISWLYNL